MKQLHTLVITVAIVVTVLFLNSCTSDMAGATTETTNGVTGLVFNVDSTPANSTIVKLFPSDYNPITDTATGTVFIDTTDSGGRYRFSRIKSGAYTIIARNRAEVTSYLKRDIAVNVDSVTTIPDGTLDRPGSISAEFSADDAVAGGYLYIPGTDITAPVTDNGPVVLAGVPSGIVDSVILVRSNEKRQNVLRGRISIASDNTTTIEMPLWKYRCRLMLNTSASGADVQNDLYDFPLLVRLDSSTFDFTQTESDGKDLLFTDSNNAPFFHEIERWDPAIRHAEVWVRVDTIHGNNSEQFITMYWGTASPRNTPAAGKVFDSTGYLGVWHLSGNGNDASLRKNDAVACTPADTEGIIGIGKKFEGTDSIKIATLLGQPQVVTLSAWAKLDTVNSDSKGAEIISIGDGCLLRMDDNQEDNFGVSGSYHLTGQSSFYHVYSGQYLKHTGWHYCAVVFDRTTRTHSLYIDGRLSSQKQSTDTINYTGVGVNTFIGIHGNGKKEYNFTGTLDEVRIRSTAINDSWIKLEYMNQKPEDELVIFNRQF